MGGRGASSGIHRGGTGGGHSITTFQDGDKTIDLSGAPLIYGAKHDLGQTDTAIKNFENRRRSAKIEFGTTVGPDGLVIGETRGGKGSVRTPVYQMMRASTFSHIHPREAGTLGGSLSPEDIDVFVKYGNLNVMRAAAKEGTYSIMRGSNFDGAGLRQYIHGVDRQIKAQTRADTKGLKEQADNLIKAYRAGNITAAEYNKEAVRINAESRTFANKALVALHNAYLDGQSKYGYSYTLEPKN